MDFKNKIDDALFEGWEELGIQDPQIKSTLPNNIEITVEHDPTHSVELEPNSTTAHILTLKTPRGVVKLRQVINIEGTEIESGVSSVKVTGSSVDILKDDTGISKRHLPLLKAMAAELIAYYVEPVTMTVEELMDGLDYIQDDFPQLPRIIKRFWSA